MTHPDGEFEYYLSAAPTGQPGEESGLNDNRHNNPYGVLGYIDETIDEAEDFARTRGPEVMRKAAVLVGAAVVLKAIKNR